MKPISVAQRVERTGEASLGPDETGNLTTYLIYGKLAPNEAGRRLRPGQGREEIFYVINGRVRMETSGLGEEVVDEGSAVPMPEGSDCWVSNITPTTVQYVIAGGFTEPVHFLHRVQQAQAATIYQSRR
ncbi:MAG: cupin domain-containing protein [Caldilineales bacterium]|nr:cupin domain-containing protein [Caldilineales bacterium]